MVRDQKLRQATGLLVAIALRSANGIWGKLGLDELFRAGTPSGEPYLPEIEKRWVRVNDPSAQRGLEVGRCWEEDLVGSNEREANSKVSLVLDLDVLIRSTTLREEVKVKEVKEQTWDG